MIAPLALMVKQDKPVHMTMIPAIAMATYTTLKITLASVNLKKKKRSENPLVHFLRSINFIDALMSVAALQNTLIMVNSTGEKDVSMIGLTAGCLLTHSAASPEFAIAVFLSMVVMYDAMGVRLETGQQAKILNRMRERDIAEGREPLFDEPLDEQMGHTLSEVIVGVIIGIAAAVIMCTWIAPLIQSVL